MQFHLSFSNLVFVVFVFHNRFAGLPSQNIPRSQQSPEAEPDNMPQKHSDGSMKNYYEAVQPELLFCLLIIPYVSLLPSNEICQSD